MRFCGSVKSCVRVRLGSGVMMLMGNMMIEEALEVVKGTWEVL